MEGHFKGTVYESTRMFTERQFGPEAVEKVLSRLSLEHRRTLEGVSAVAWCPVAPVLAYHHELDKVFGTGDLAVCVQAGRFSAGWAMNTVLKVFLRFKSPAWLLVKATSVWSRNHDTGRWVLQPGTEQRIVGELHDFVVKDPAFCARLRGWLTGAVEATGGKRATVMEPRCVCRGHEFCQFVVTWQV